MRLRRLLTAGALAAVAIGALAPTAGAVTTIRNGGSTGLQLLATKLAQEYKVHTHGAVKVTVTGGGSGAGISAVNAGTLDIGNSSRDPRASDPPGLNFYAISREPFVIIINPKNKVKNLTKAQIKGILTGAITNWSAVGWAGGGAIQVYGRISTSGTFASCKTLFTDGEEYTSTAPALASNGLDRQAVANHKRGIACVTLPYLTTSKGKVKGVKVNGIAPTLRNAAAGRYKYINKQYFVTKGVPTGAPLAYLKWVVKKKTQCNIVSRYALPIVKC
jgi:phosphate transport system substrate-binding protein